MKFSRLERITIGFTALLLAFLSGWFLCRQQEAARPFVPAAAETSPALPASSPEPEQTAPETQRVNINTADAEQLQTLPGIGEKRAADIIAYREAHGPFTIPEQLSDVPGIGPSLLSGIIDLITTEE